MKKIAYVFSLCFLLAMFVFLQFGWAQKVNKKIDNTTPQNTSQRLAAIDGKLATIENQQDTNINDQKEYVRTILSISGNTVKFVGTVAAILLPLLIFLIGFQVLKSNQLENEIKEAKEAKKGIEKEYEEIKHVRAESERLALVLKAKIDTLQDVVAELATNQIQKTTAKVANLTAQTEQVLAEIRTKDDELNKSIELMRKLETLDLTLTPSIYLERGKIYLEQENWDKAIENFNSAIKLEPGNHLHYFHRGLTYHRMQKYDEAIKDYNKSLEISPTVPATHANLANCYRNIKNYPLAIQHLSTAIDMRPRFEFALSARAETYMLLNKYKLAFKDFTEAEKLNSKSYQIKTGFGIYYAKKGNFDNAIKYYLQALAIKPTTSTKLNLSEAYLCTKDFINAEKYANDVFISPSNSYDKIMSQYLIVVIAILNNKDSSQALRSLALLIKEDAGFDPLSWSFEELLTCVKFQNIPSETIKSIERVIGLIKKEIEPDAFLG